MSGATNEPSQRLMARLGMTRSAAEDFDHPAVASGRQLERHVRYRLRASDWPGAAAVIERAARAATAT